jgi:hypothetical protein
MRKWMGLVAIAVAGSTAGCVQSMDQGYGYGNGYYGNSGYYDSGYSNAYASSYYPTSYYGSSGYYGTPSVNNYYYNPSPTVVTQTRYVPVPTPVPVPVPTRQADRSWWRDHSSHQQQPAPQPQQPTQHVDRPHHTPPATPQASNTQQPTPTPNTGSHRGNWRDRDGDGKPDRPDRRS